MCIDLWNYVSNQLREEGKRAIILSFTIIYIIIFIGAFFFLNGFKLLFLVTCFQIEELPLVFLVREVC